MYCWTDIIIYTKILLINVILSNWKQDLIIYKPRKSCKHQVCWPPSLKIEEKTTAESEPQKRSSRYSWVKIQMSLLRHRDDQVRSRDQDTPDQPLYLYFSFPKQQVSVVYQEVSSCSVPKRRREHSVVI